MRLWVAPVSVLKEKPLNIQRFLILSASFLCLSFTTALAKPSLTQNDFKYIGTFMMPSGLVGSGPWTHRYVNGQLRMFYTNNLAANVFESNVPTPSLTEPYPRAQMIRNWGDVAGSKRPFGSVSGLYWDPVDQRLYWNFQENYNSCCPDNPSIGYTVLNDGAGTVTSFGPWRFANRSTKMTNTCFMPLPQWFADANTGGRRLAVGCGGYQSVWTTGPASIGPALTAFAPPTPGSNPELSSLSNTALVGYPMHQGAPYSTPDRPRRDIHYVNEYDQWNPQNGVGYWSWTDGAFGFPGVWIDLPNKSGAVFFPNITMGRTFYQDSDLNHQAASTWWYLYGSDDLAQVAQGAKQQWAIQPSSYFEVHYPKVTYPFPENPNGVEGATFDATANRLYVAMKVDMNDGTAEHYVHVYQVGENVGWVAPPPHSGPPAITLSASPTRLPEIVQNGTAYTNKTVLLWTSEGAASLSINQGVGSVPVVGIRTIPINQTTTFTLTATNSFGTSTQQVTVTMNGVPPPPSSPCDINIDGSVNVNDVQLCTNQVLGIASCTGDINRDGQCTVVDVQRVVNAALGGQCVSP
jgi:hypothetical protein